MPFNCVCYRPLNIVTGRRALLWSVTPTLHKCLWQLPTTHVSKVRQLIQSSDKVREKGNPTDTFKHQSENFDDSTLTMLRKFRNNLAYMSRYYKVLILIALLLSFIHVIRMFRSSTQINRKVTRKFDDSLVREYQQLQQFALKHNRDTKFHGHSEVAEFMKHKNFLQSIEEKEVIKVKEGRTKIAGTEKSAWILCSDRKVTDHRFWPTIGNGHLATVVRSNTVFMNGLYNGNGTKTHRARIPGYISLVLVNVSQPITEQSYCLNMQTGIYTETYKGNQWTLTVNMYAHRTQTRLLVTEIVLQTDGQESLQANFSLNEGPPSTDVRLVNGTREFLNSRCVYGTILTPELPSARRTPVHIYYSSYSPNFDIPGSVKNTFRKIFLLSASPFVTDAREAFQKGLDMYKAGTLETTHMKGWQDLWEAGRIDINGNTVLAKSAYSCLYYILSAMPTVAEPTWPFVGLSPGDLAHGAAGKDYSGHVFWDQDTWMYPPILVLNADLGKTLVNTRLRTLDNAYVNAELLGLKGAMYPWESAFEGLNTSPSYATTVYELHVTGDVAFGFQQYLMMTGDTDLLRKGRLKEAIGAIAEFWESRITYEEKKDRYEILKVMPPDEWNWPVNNSVYTNQLVKMSLLLPKYAYSLIKEEAPKQYEQIAQKMFIIQDDVQKYHPEYEGYTLKTAVKQADVVLLGFPLDMPMLKEYRLNDLTFYEKVTPGGPAMTWGMFAIGWIEMGHPEKAESLFTRQLLNQQEPFNVWTETAIGEGAVNFITGQGGFLQSIIFGYGGLRIREDLIEMKCTPLPNAESFLLKNIDYLGNSLDILCATLKTEVTLTVVGTPLILNATTKGEKHVLQLGRTVIVPNEKFTIYKDAS